MSDQPWAPERYHEALQVEIGRFLAVVSDAAPDTPVPTCPDWTVARLTTHLGLLYRWVDRLVRDSVQEPLWPHQLGITAPTDGLAEWTSKGFEQMLATIRTADPDAPVWSWGGDQHVWFWLRRMLFETLIHRCDAELALGRSPFIEPAVAIDGVDEFLSVLAHAFWVAENLRALGGGGETVHLHATDSSGEWLITLTPEGFTWEHGHGKGTAAVRATAADLLLMTYGRVPPTGDAFTVFGDAELLGRWLSKSAL